MANTDPRIKFYEENGVYTRAQKAREARLGRTSAPVDVTQIPRLATVLPESRAAIDAQMKEQQQAQSDNPHSLVQAAASGRFMLQPPGSPWAKSKDELVNGPAKRP